MEFWVCLSCVWWPCQIYLLILKGCGFFNFSTNTVRSFVSNQVITILYLPFQSVCFFFFPWLTELARIFRDDTSYPFLIAKYSKTVFNNSPVIVKFIVDFWQIIFISLRKFLFWVHFIVVVCCETGYISLDLLLKVWQKSHKITLAWYLWLVSLLISSVSCVLLLLCYTYYPYSKFLRWKLKFIFCLPCFLMNTLF